MNKPLNEWAGSTDTDVERYYYILLSEKCFKNYYTMAFLVLIPLLYVFVCIT